MRPYYQDEAVTIYHGDCRDILPHLGRFDLLLTDPPYGIGADSRQSQRANKQHGRAAAPSKDYGVTEWDSLPSNELISDIRLASEEAVIWGGNYFELPPSRAWLVWDKCNGDNGYADCELAWTNLDTAVRKFTHRWAGMLQEDMGNKEYRSHPTQKPEALMRWCIGLAGPSVMTVLDPFMGSGTTLVAAKRLGLKAVGIDREESYCAIASERCAQGVLSFA